VSRHLVSLLTRVHSPTPSPLAAPHLQDRTYAAPASLSGGRGQVWIADSHLPGSGFDLPWFNVLAWGNQEEPMQLAAGDFYSEARWSGSGGDGAGGGPGWDGQLTHHWVWDWRDPCVRTGDATK
jgi:hypothetical protein